MGGPGVPVEPVVGIRAPAEVAVATLAHEAVPPLDGLGQSHRVDAGPRGQAGDGVVGQEPLGIGIARSGRHHRVARPVLPIEDHPARQVAGGVLVDVEGEERLAQVVVVPGLVDEALAEPVDHDRVGGGALHADEPGQGPPVVALTGHGGRRVPPGLVHVAQVGPDGHGHGQPVALVAGRAVGMGQGPGQEALPQGGVPLVPARGQHHRPGRQLGPTTVLLHHQPGHPVAVHGELAGPGLEARHDAGGQARLQQRPDQRLPAGHQTRLHPGLHGGGVEVLGSVRRTPLHGGLLQHDGQGQHRWAPEPSGPRTEPPGVVERRLQHPSRILGPLHLGVVVGPGHRGELEGRGPFQAGHDVRAAVHEVLEQVGRGPTGGEPSHVGQGLGP